jgi:hypothetical protein
LEKYDLSIPVWVLLIPLNHPMRNHEEILCLSPLTENLQYQRVIKDQAVPGEEEAARLYTVRVDAIGGPIFRISS